MQFFQNNNVFASREENKKEQIITCGISKQLCVSNYSCRSCHKKYGKFAYLHQDTTDWTLVFLGYLGLASYGTEMSPETMHLEDLSLGKVLEWFPAWPNV